MTAVLDRNPAEVMAALQAATANLSPEERVRVTEGVARSMREATRAERWATPGALAARLDPTVVQTPAMDKLDELLLGVDRALKGEQGAVRRGGAFLPPQEGKSTRISQHGLAWLLSRHPQLRVGIVSYEQTIALRSGRAVRDLIDTHGSAPDRDLSHDLLGIAVDPDERAESRWKLKGHRGGVVSVGIGGALTGRPLDVLVVDDPIKDARAADSLLIRQRAWDWYSSTARTRLAPGGIVLVVQTRWHEDDLSGRLIEQDRARPADRRLWTWVNIPAQGIGELKPGDTRLPDSLGRPAGEYMVSARGRSLADWEETRDEVAGRDWSAMYQQNPTPAEGTVFQWAWINRYRRAVPGAADSGDPATSLPAAAKRAVAVDTSAGGTDEAGLVAGFRGNDGVVYVTHDRSAPMTSAQWARAAWLLCVDTDADTLVWEKNLAGPTMRTELVRAWRLLQRQARVLRRHVSDDLVADDDALDTAARQLADADAGGDADDELVADTRAQLQELTADRLRRILAAPDSGYAQLHGVQATSGKRTRATPIAAQYETGRQRHVGFLPELEQQMTTWQEGQDSPDRMDAVVWLGHYLGAAPHRTRARTPSATTIPRGPQVRGR